MLSYIILLYPVLQSALDDTNNPQAPSRVLKQLKHESTVLELELAQREAELRSGARGIRARKALISKEKETEESLAK